MLYKTRGIALSFLKYKETSIIAKIYTEAFGMQTYIVNSIRSSSSKTKMALFQPLTILELVVYHNKKKEINRINEIKCSFTFQTIPYQIRKTSIALFLTEVLHRVLKEEEQNELLFEFIHESIIFFDEVKDQYENFHLQFMLALSRYLGIRPESAQALLEETGYKFNTGFVEQLDFMLHSNYGQYLRLSKTDRNEILMLIIDHFRSHYDTVRDFKSIQVLKETLS